MKNGTDTKDNATMLTENVLESVSGGANSAPLPDPVYRKGQYVRVRTEPRMYVYGDIIDVNPAGSRGYVYFIHTVCTAYAYGDKYDYTAREGVIDQFLESMGDAVTVINSLPKAPYDEYDGYPLL